MKKIVYNKKIIYKKIKIGLFIIFTVIFAVWLFWPYVEVKYLSWKYGKYFEEGYRESKYFANDPYMKTRVLRYRKERARIGTDSGLVKIMLEEDMENTAVVCYASVLVMVFRYNGEEWKMDTLDGYGENWIMIHSGTADNIIWPYYIG